jgi:cobalt-zinc-cadmium efflux system membrane fusion protein
MKKKARNAVAIFLVLALLGLSWSVVQWNLACSSKLNIPGSDSASNGGSVLDVAQGQLHGIRITSARIKELGIQLVEVKPAPPPEPLRLSGTTLLDPNSMVRIHARFPGELVGMGNVSAGDTRRANDIGVFEPRALQYGDIVFKGEILAVVRSKDLGEKKSEYVDAISQLEIDAALLQRYEAVQTGVLSERALFEARRGVEADRITVERAERTLRSWRLTEAELRDLRDEAKRVQEHKARDVQGDRTWAATVIRSPINGIIVEKNFNVGDLLDPSQDLLKIADLDRVQVMANAYEEDLPLLKNLQPEQRNWRVDIKANPHDVPIEGTFDIVGGIIDPTQHAGAVIGWLDNPDGQISIGEFINATIDLPPDPTLVTIPTSALIENGDFTKVFVATNAEKHEFAIRKVAVVSRGRERTYVRSQPTPEELADGAEPLKDGEDIVMSGALQLAAEMNELQGSATSLKLSPNALRSLSKTPHFNPVRRSGEKTHLRSIREIRS